MENTNKKFLGQGKTQKQYKNSMRFFSGAMIGIILLILMVLLTGCFGPAQFDRRQYNIDKYGIDYGGDLSYYDGNVYYGYHSGWYYYYGKPHYYPWYYYYNTCPPSYYNTTTHIIVKKPVIKPTHRPNRPIVKPTHRPNVNIKTNVNRNKVNIKTNKSNNSNKTRVNIKRKPR